MTSSHVLELRSTHRCHVTNKASDVATFSLPADRQSGAPRTSQQFDGAAIDLVSEQTRGSILCLNQEWLVEEAKILEDHGTLLQYRNPLRFLKTLLSRASFTLLNSAGVSTMSSMPSTHDGQRHGHRFVLLAGRQWTAPPSPFNFDRLRATCYLRKIV